MYTKYIRWLLSFCIREAVRVSEVVGEKNCNRGDTHVPDDAVDGERHTDTDGGNHGEPAWGKRGGRR